MHTFTAFEPPLTRPLTPPSCHVSLSYLVSHPRPLFFFFFNDTPTPEIYPLPLHDPLPISRRPRRRPHRHRVLPAQRRSDGGPAATPSAATPLSSSGASRVSASSGWGIQPVRSAWQEIGRAHV